MTDGPGGSRHRPALNLARAAILSLLAGACGGHDDPAREAVLELEAAAEARDVDRFARRLSDRFRARDGSDKAAAAAILRRYFAAYEALAVTLHDLQVEPEEGGFSARFLAELSGEGRKALGLGLLLPADAVYRFELSLVEEGGLWRVREASYERVAPREE